MDFLINVAKRTIENHLNNPDYPHTIFQIPEVDKNKTGGVFVTIKKNGNLRGCIGKIISHQNIVATIQEMALQAAFHDPRFPPVTKEELGDLEYEVTILQPPTPVTEFSEIEIGKHGLIIENGFNRGLLLPQVATEYGWGVMDFVKQTCLKAGLDQYAYQRRDTHLLKFEAEVITAES